jgi:hypothetical protein
LLAAAVVVAEVVAVEAVELVVTELLSAAQHREAVLLRSLRLLFLLVLRIQ